MNTKVNRTRTPPATTLEGREGQLVNLAVSLAEKQLLNGSASSQVITHFLKLGSVRAMVELEQLKKENELLSAKTQAIESGQRLEALYKEALQAMRLYKGSGDFDEDL